MKPHHGAIRALSPSESINLLKRNHLGHLACHAKDDIYLVPVTYMFEDGFIYSHSKLGKKIEMMRQNPQVCIQVEEVEDFFRWKSVIAWGQFEELKSEEAATVMRSLVKRLTAGEEYRSDLEVYFESLLNSAIVYRVKVERSTGRCEGFD